MQRRDFDRARGTIRIERIVTKGDVAEPKMKSHREVPVFDWLAAELTAHLAQTVPAFDRSDWMFATALGKPLHWNGERSWGIGRCR